MSETRSNGTVSEHDGEPLAGGVDALVVAGWTGRDAAGVEHHIRELEAIGVAPPSEVPLFYRVSAALLGPHASIEVVGEESSGEVEPMLVRAGGRLWLGLASDHTDRALEAHSVALSKQICAKPCAASLWPLAGLRDAPGGGGSRRGGRRARRRGWRATGPTGSRSAWTRSSSGRGSRTISRATPGRSIRKERSRPSARSRRCSRRVRCRRAVSARPPCSAARCRRSVACARRTRSASSFSIRRTVARCVTSTRCAVCPRFAEPGRDRCRGAALAPACKCGAGPARRTGADRHGSTVDTSPPTTRHR